MKNIILFLTIIVTLSLQSSTQQTTQQTAESSSVTPCDQMNNCVTEESQQELTKKNITLGLRNRVRAQLINAQASVSDTCIEIKEACQDGLAQAANFAKSASQLAIEIIGFPVCVVYFFATGNPM